MTKIKIYYITYSFALAVFAGVFLVASKSEASQFDDIEAIILLKISHVSCLILLKMFTVFDTVEDSAAIVFDIVDDINIFYLSLLNIYILF